MRATLSLFHQDPAKPALIRGVLSALAVGLLFRMVPDLSAGITRLQTDDLPDGFVYLYLVLTAFIVFLVLSGNSWTRSSRLALGLPLSARKVWAVRMASLVAIALFSAAVLGVSTGVTFDLDHHTLAFNPVILLSAARAMVATVLLLFIFQLPLGDRDRIPITAAYVVYMAFIGVLMLVISTIAIPSMTGTLVILLITLLHGAFLYLRIPPSFSIGPTVEEGLSPVWETSKGIELADSAGWDSRNVDRSRRVLHKALFRGLKPNLLIWMLLAIVGASVTVATLEFLSGTNAFMALFFIVIYHLPLLQGALESMTPLDSLPISRRVLWAHAVGPIAAAAALGLGIATVIHAFNPDGFVQVHLNKCCVQVPWDYWEISRDGEVPPVTTAWGESFTPHAHPLWRGRSVALFDPYESGPESSPRFVEHQVQRAVQAVYGVPVPETSFEVAPETPPQIDSESNREGSTHDVIRGRMSGDRGRTAAVALIVLCVLLTGIMLPALLQYGPWVHRKVFKRVSIGFIVLLVVAAVGVSLARLLDFTQVWYIGVLVSMGMRSLAHAVPLPTTFLWILCMIFWFGAYLILGRVFSLVEFPKEKTMNRFAEEY